MYWKGVARISTELPKTGVNDINLVANLSKLIFHNYSLNKLQKVRTDAS